MKLYGKAVLGAVSLLLSAGIGLAADGKASVTDVKSAATSIGSGVKSDVKASAISIKGNVKSNVSNVKSAKKTKLVDINTATDTELKSVPGIGGALAARIIAGRPYANKAQLKSRKIVPETVYEQMKDFLIARMIKR